MTLSSACFVVIGGYIGDREPRPHTRLLKGNSDTHILKILFILVVVVVVVVVVVGGGGEGVNREFDKTVRMYINNYLSVQQSKQEVFMNDVLVLLF